MSIVTALKQKQQKQKQQKQKHDIIEQDFISCTQENKAWFMNELKTKTPEVIPLIKQLIESGLMPGIRNVSIKVK